MTNDKDSAVLAERVERVTKWLDGGCSTWGTPAQDIREVINALRQPTQSDALKIARDALEGMVRYSGMRESWQDDNPQYVNAASDAIGAIDAALQEQSK